ncbi:hypothetical protein E2320_011020 [Naja naja]|nr:hypothetical protein E2320_011020 [Naja naja]
MENPSTPDDFWAILTVSIILHAFHKILARKLFPFGHGFLKKESYLDVTILLNSILWRIHTSQVVCAMLFQDVPKAFSTVCHQTLFCVAFIDHISEALVSVFLRVIFRLQSNRKGMYGQSLHSASMSLNAKKFFGLTITKSGKHKYVPCNPTSKQFAGNFFHPLWPNDSVQYLGLQFNCKVWVILKHTSTLESRHHVTRTI